MHRVHDVWEYTMHKVNKFCKVDMQYNIEQDMWPQWLSLYVTLLVDLECKFCRM